MVGRSARFAPARCLRWDWFASQRVLGARVAVIAVAWTCWPRGHGPLELALLVLERRSESFTFRFCAVSILRFARVLRSRVGVGDRGLEGGWLGWRPPGGHGLDPPPTSYKTGAENISDPKTPRVGIPRPLGHLDARDQAAVPQRTRGEQCSQRVSVQLQRAKFECPACVSPVD